MPRLSVGGGFSQLQQHARKLVGTLASEIRSRKDDLARIEAEYAKVVAIAGSRVATPVPKEAKRVNGKRTDWKQVLAKLPKEFKASDIRKTRGMKAKRPSEIFAGITRWIEGGAVKKKKRGIYLKTK